MEKKLVIIGAGIAGLSAGCYARMNGYDVEIHESHTQPGGMCTAWKRGGYTIDGCLEWLVGSRPGSGELYSVWEELGAVQGKDYIYYDVYADFHGRDGRRLHCYTDLERFERHLVELSPRDVRAARSLCEDIGALSKMRMPLGKPFELTSRWDDAKSVLRMAPSLIPMARLGRLTLQQLGDRFSDPFLRSSFANCMNDPSERALGILMVLGILGSGTTGYMLGGSLEFARTIERRFLDLGGRAVYGSRVTKVLERDGRATGVRLADGEEIAAERVVSACDMRTTLFSMLDGSRIDPVHRELLETGKLFPPIVHVAFGVGMDFSSEISCAGTFYELERPFEVAGRTITMMSVRNQCHDPSLAPPGKSVVIAMLNTDWSHWEPLLDDRAAYKAEKERIAAFVREQIEQRKPGFTSKIEMTDVATPVTWERYTGDWHGTYMTWIPTPSKPLIRMRKSVPGLADFYMASMWTNGPGGLPGAAQAGREVVQLMCRDDGKRFETSK